MTIPTYGALPADARSAAAYYIERGFLPVPVPRTGRSKAPVLDGWPDLRPTHADLDRLFPAGESLNLGLLLGEPSGGLIDIDLDAAEAVTVGPMLLPRTGWVSGHKSKPKSHFWYRVTDPPNKAQDKYADLDGTDLLEVRSTRGQTVVPPGIHESGERIVWHQFDQPAEVDMAELLATAQAAAAASLLARHWPSKGSRHDARLALSGALTRAGWPEDRVATFVKAVTVAAGNEGVRDAEKVGESSLARNKEGGKTWGWPMLEKLLGFGGKEVVELARDWLGCRRAVVAELPIPDPLPWPDPPAEEAFHGLAGRIVRTIEPASEADPAALLVQTLVAVGNVIGRGAHFTVEADRHHGNEFVVLVGKTSKARKGTSWGRISHLFREAEEQWAAERIQSGASSGEGIIWSVRDAIHKQERIKERGEPVRYEEVEADPGVQDKRLLIYEPEFANVLKQTERQGNTLSVILRQAWDGLDLRSLTKNSPARATGAHISLVGHITADELRRYLTSTEMANGYANRHLWTCADRSKLLPEGGRVDPEAWSGLRNDLAEALAFSRTVGEVARDAEARTIWREVYGPLSDGRPGLAGALLARAEAHVMRLALLYALMDRSPVIQAPHLMAALALWDYCERSVYFVFGDALGDPLADELLRLLRSNPQGLTRTDLSSYLGRNQTTARIGRALGLLLQHHLARREQQEQQETGGRPAERWFAAAKGRDGKGG
jgi:hypothetical protein